MDLKTADKTYIAGTYKRFPVEIVSGKGSVAFGADGKRYIDMGSGIGVTAFGIADDAWRETVTEQAGKVQHTSNLYYTEPCVRLAQMLCERTGMKKVFFSNSGAEANECAIKVARKYSAEKKGADCCTIVTLENSFHGRTLTTLAATGQDKFHTLFQPLTPGFVQVPANDFDALRTCVQTEKIAGVMLECIQGEGGVIALDADYIRKARALTQDKDIPMLVDEVQTGNGRTGKLYAYQHFGVEPDVVSTAKGLAGGLPLGATLMAEKVQDVLSFGDHGSTFGGNPVCCAAACSILSRIDDALLEEVRQKSTYLFDTLRGTKGVKSVSGMGLMIGVETERPVADVLGDCLQNGVLCLSAKTKLRLLPALNIPWDTLREAVAVIQAACQPTEKE